MPSTVLLVKSDPDADPRDSCAWIISSAGSSLGTLRPVCLPKISTAGGGSADESDCACIATRSVLPPTRSVLLHVYYMHVQHVTCACTCACNMHNM